MTFTLGTILIANHCSSITLTMTCATIPLPQSRSCRISSRTRPDGYVTRKNLLNVILALPVQQHYEFSLASPNVVRDAFESFTRGRPSSVEAQVVRIFKAECKRHTRSC